MSRFEKAFEMILRKMFSYVECDFDNFDFDRKDWFEQCTWTQAQQEDFKNWLTNEILTNKEVRKVFNTTNRSKKIAKSIAEFFVFNWGWKARRD